MTKYFIFALIVLSAFMAGRYTKNSDVVYQQDIKPVEHIIIKPVDPANLQDLIDRANSPILIDRLFEGLELTCTASDGYKKTITHDNIFLTPTKHFVFAGFGLDRQFSFVYTVGYMRSFYFDSLYIGAYASFNRTSFNSINALVGYSF